jgi:formylglycine-generating enzyme required for sulfatase activity
MHVLRTPSRAALVAGLLTALFIGHSAQAQLASPCDGVEVALATGERRCVHPGAGKATSFKDCPDCPEMVVVPAGSFTMGSPPGEIGRAADREDQVPVVIAQPFAVGALAVTRGEFAAFTKATGHTPDGGCYIWTGTTWVEEASRDWRSVNFPQDDRHPVTCVSFADATAYAAWLSATTGKTYRLLSEAEREYVTRAGSTTPFWWGSSISTRQANYDGRLVYAGGPKGDWLQRTLPADAFAANPWGLFNVHGNVWEWVSDCWTEKNAGNPGDGTPRLTGDCSWRVVRGGAWNYDPAELRSAHRYWNLPGNRNTGTGFRIARML